MEGPWGIPQLEELIKRFLNLSVGFAFVAILIMLIMGGIKFLTSGGEQKGIQQGSNTITWAILGIVFLVLAWLIILLIKAFTGVDVTRFCLSFDGCP